MKILSWNVANRFKKQKYQLDAVITRSPDVIGLQEITFRTLPLWVEGFHKSGYPHTISSFDLAKDISLLTGPRRYGLLIASRYPLSSIDPQIVEIPWKERLLSASIFSTNAVFEFHTAHIPPGISHKWLKINTFNGIYQYLSNANNQNLRILCGDFNSPQAELKTGEVITWGQRIKQDNTIRYRRNRYTWDAGERSVIEGLAEHDLHDVFRLINGYEKECYSWVVIRKGMIKAKRRFDHIFASMKLYPISCQYIHEFRENNLSDHSAIEAEFNV
ncbi:MAG: endonuclease/exonuclease/phosphatase family protein [Anaerolineaceae bacterium]|nr:endonuclease/exonuclease/phosphatase family protein [Anaerolineaceae bacterium]